MKKIILVFMIVVGVVSYSRDYEYMERKEVGRYVKVDKCERDIEKVGRVAFSYWSLDEDDLEKESRKNS